MSELLQYDVGMGDVQPDFRHGHEDSLKSLETIHTDQYQQESKVRPEGPSLPA